MDLLSGGDCNTRCVRGSLGEREVWFCDNCDCYVNSDPSIEGLCHICSSLEARGNKGRQDVITGNNIEPGLPFHIFTTPPVYQECGSCGIYIIGTIAHTCMGCSIDPACFSIKPAK
jgi:hypothetical protein